MSSVTVLLINAIVYTLTLVYFIKKFRLSVGVFIWVLYTVSAWSSFLFVQQPGYGSSGHYSEQTIFPCIYLYIVFIISMYPLMKLNVIEDISFHNLKIVKFIMIICTLVYFVFFIVDIPIMTDITRLGTNALNEFRNNMYGEQGNSLVYANYWLNKVSLLFTGMRVLSIGLSIIAFVSFKDNRRLVNIFFIACFLENLRIILTSVGRGELVLVTLLYGSIFYLMRNWISKKKKRTLILCALPILICAAIFFWVITLSRFGSNTGYFMYKYLGEPINNFNGLLFNNISGHTYGRAYFSIFYRYLLGQRDFTSGLGKWDLIIETTGVRGDIFYTWVGGLIIEFGKIVPVIVALLINRIMMRLTAIKKYYYGDAVVAIFFLNFFIRGIFLFPVQSFEGNLMIIDTIILYFLFRVQRGKNGSIVLKVPKLHSRKQNLK